MAREGRRVPSSKQIFQPAWDGRIGIINKITIRRTKARHDDADNDDGGPGRHQLVPDGDYDRRELLTGKGLHQIQYYIHIYIYISFVTINCGHPALHHTAVLGSSGKQTGLMVVGSTASRVHCKLRPRLRVLSASQNHCTAPNRTVLGSSGQQTVCGCMMIARRNRTCPRPT